MLTNNPKCTIEIVRSFSASFVQVKSSILLSPRLSLRLSACLLESSMCVIYGVVPKGLLTFFGSLYKEVEKTTSGTLVYRFERETARKNVFLPKTLSPRLRM